MQDFFKKESSGGIILILAAIIAIVAANSPLESFYKLLLSTSVEVRVGTFEIAKPLLLWINDGLMAIFFLFIGLELKREIIEGNLSERKNIILPGIGAVGGMCVPAAIYVFFNADDPVGLQGWAIPAATDIAFALGILALLGSRVPVSLKIFLTSLAIFDDIGAISIIALFYTTGISASAILVVTVCIFVLYIFNTSGFLSKSLYIFVGVIMWIATLKSGIHATLAGIVLAMFIPLNDKKTNISPLKELEQDLHHLVVFFVLPIFAFANAGIALGGITLDQVVHGVPAGIAAGLFFGKPIGIFGLCWLAIKLKFAKLPAGTNFLGLYGVATLCGVGFTMSFFIGSLAFEETGINLLFDERLGIIAGSIASGIVGFFLIRSSLKSHKGDTSVR
ncbi:Na+/H+ antiporter NhaA [Desulforhopalus vacuolatus]|uniref:Na+/H+ antiporter NhaA n=1 Tax=Desulforhopalus vacuolatus TaxID=40414 RepID=UPI0019624820|nr:Na+/H+ antiporter NhaA [Desulforhopalus vacuolatus]MBM9519734.1 Na+/H+ antiporter NhaA [Desulforhopalus vacuolatus]